MTESAPSRRRVYILTSLLLFIGLAALKIHSLDLQSTVQLHDINSLRGATISTHHDLINVAKGKSATQSSTFSIHTADRAIDGDSTTFSFTSATDPRAWIEIDLQGMYPIHSINLVNEWCVNDKKVCSCKLTDAKLMLLDEFWSPVVEKYMGGLCGITELLEEFDEDCTFKRLVCYITQ